MKKYILQMSSLGITRHFGSNYVADKYLNSVDTWIYILFMNPIIKTFPLTPTISSSSWRCHRQDDVNYGPVWLTFNYKTEDNYSPPFQNSTRAGIHKAVINQSISSCLLDLNKYLGWFKWVERSFGDVFFLILGSNSNRDESHYYVIITMWAICVAL